MPTMRIAVAGAGGLGCLLAHCIKEETSHNVIILSRAVCYSMRINMSTELFKT